MPRRHVASLGSSPGSGGPGKSTRNHQEQQDHHQDPQDQNTSGPPNIINKSSALVGSPGGGIGIPSPAGPAKVEAPPVVQMPGVEQIHWRTFTIFRTIHPRRHVTTLVRATKEERHATTGLLIRDAIRTKVAISTRRRLRTETKQTT